MDVILTNARLALDHEVVAGTLVHRDGVIRDVSGGRSHAAGAIDLDGDLLAPGLIEVHTDNMEKHFLPRPGVIWPNPLAAALAHDAQMAAAGVTTVYDAVCAGGYDGGQDHRRAIFDQMIDALEQGVARGLFRIDHRLHLRCELTDAELMPVLEPRVGSPLLALASLMDHTPGQRQWRNLDDLRRFMTGSGLSREGADELLRQRMEVGRANVAMNRPAAAALLRARGVALASHDDTTAEDVSEARADGCAISEFPTTREAARAARDAGLATVAGAPNVVRGGSHSGGVAVAELAEEGLLDALSSDYVPSSLLQAVERLGGDDGAGLAKAIGYVTSGPADMLGLADRGRLKPGLRADLIRVAFAGGAPVVREATVAGRRVM
ncbi:amidohydrolase [Methylopila jiangsuensis]|uniref:Amidohydrolase n=1 Tax=Methylopila jiangsuensis TaxID=586230 RepID=A0A9W6JKE4_9HYPH|nr:alpha-D-ribose 1-methylphosphonate 5-triphosphate diphosphatase [Methylopila jiangsuensis]MDR6284787.1 alpha-D-ribose 1-methylphosphonate 5-triphosphate diphosphatase [Methylopila jiangsuensis]GLK77823.1 amidohydrolase [Methylopila jiangsuensis]